MYDSLDENVENWENYVENGLWIDPIMDQSMDVPPHPIMGKEKM